jgi:hypothetical protein
MILIDTGFFVALHSKEDVFHKQAKHASQKFARELWLTTWPVITETCYFLQKRDERLLEPFFRLLLEETLKIIDIPKDEIMKLSKLMTQYQNLPMDLADASLVWLAEVLNEGRILSTDQRDFNAYRWKNQHPFQNLLLGDS